MKNTKTLKGQINFKQYLIPCTIFSKYFYEILNINSRTESKRFPLIILLRLLLNGDISYFLLSLRVLIFGSIKGWSHRESRNEYGSQKSIEHLVRFESKTFRFLNPFGHFFKRKEKEIEWKVNCLSFLYFLILFDKEHFLEEFKFWISKILQ